MKLRLMCLTCGVVIEEERFETGPSEAIALFHLREDGEVCGDGKAPTVRAERVE